MFDFVPSHCSDANVTILIITLEMTQVRVGVHLRLGNLVLKFMDLPTPLQRFLLVGPWRTSVIGPLDLLDDEWLVDLGTLSCYRGYHDRRGLLLQDSASDWDFVL